MTKALCQGRIGKLDWVAGLVGDPPDANSTADTDTHLLSHIGDNLSTPPIIGDQCCHMKRRNESVYQKIVGDLDALHKDKFDHLGNQQCGRRTLEKKWQGNGI